jgi:tetratricopeptide (TPR) repeat protein
VLSRLTSDPAAEAYALLATSEVYQRAGRTGDATASLADSLDLFRRIRQPLGEARALLRSGELLYEAGDYRAAENALRLALVRAAPTDAVRWIAAIRVALGDVLAASSRPDEARAHWVQALRTYEQLVVADAETVRSRLLGSGVSDG